jgi:hypothetical protein
MNDRELSQYLDLNFLPVKNLEETPPQEHGIAVFELAEFLGIPLETLRSRLLERGELMEVSGVEYCLRWQQVSDEVATAMQQSHVEFKEALLGYRKSAEQGFMTLEAAWAACHEEFERQKAALAREYRRFLAL